MIQFIKFATLDPVGFALVKVSDISSIASTIESKECKVVTAHGEYLVEGTFEQHSDNLNAWLGSAWDAVLEEV